jgi:hypothetical protein
VISYGIEPVELRSRPIEVYLNALRLWFLKRFAFDSQCFVLEVLNNATPNAHSGKWFPQHLCEALSILLI